MSSNVRIVEMAMRKHLRTANHK